MIALPLWLASLGPLALLLAYLAPGFFTATSARATRGLAAAAAIVNLLAALSSAVAVVWFGALHTPPLQWHGIGCGIYMDAISATMFCLVSFIGAIVLRYSFAYMEGDAREALFLRLMCLTLSAVLLLAISGNVFQFALMFVATSMALQRLLVFYPERPAALFAARKKFFFSRIGDASLIAAAVLLWRVWGDLDYASLFRQAEALRATNVAMPAIGAAGLLLVIAALLTSAQFPTHGWLLEVMETPTPVSALLHAGIVNAGGFLVIRFADIVSLSLSSLHVLAVIGGLTALFGSVVMLTQTSIKASLACSTVAQMGFMMLECGLGAFAAAMLHIVAHSFYKAHAFLSSGSVIDIYRTSFTPSPGGKPHRLRWIFAIATVLAVAFAFSIATGYTVTARPGVFTLGAVLLLSLIHLMANGIDERPNAYVVLRVAALACVVALAYFGLQFVTDVALAAALPKAQPLRGPFSTLVVVLIVASYAATVWLQATGAKNQASPRWQAFYAHVHSGFYVNTFANRLVLRYWPGPAPSAVPAALPLRARAHA